MPKQRKPPQPMKTSQLISRLQEISNAIPFDADVVTGDDWMPASLVCVEHDPPHTFLVFEEPDKGKKAFDLVKTILARHYGGIYKRIDENRELLELLQRDAPELLAKQPWVVGWLESQDGFLRDLESAVTPNGVQFKRTSPSGQSVPRPWPLSSD